MWFSLFSKLPENGIGFGIFPWFLWIYGGTSDVLLNELLSSSSVAIDALSSLLVVNTKFSSSKTSVELLFSLLVLIELLLSSSRPSVFFFSSDGSILVSTFKEKYLYSISVNYVWPIQLHIPNSLWHPVPQ